MMPSKLGRCSQLRLGFAAVLAGLKFSQHSKKYVLYINSYSSTLQQPEGWGEVDSQMMFILYEQLLCAFATQGISHINLRYVYIIPKEKPPLGFCLGTSKI